MVEILSLEIAILGFDNGEVEGMFMEGSLYSTCGKETTGGSRARNIVRSKNGTALISSTPRHRSDQVLMKLIPETPSTNIWLSAVLTQTPPHLKRVILTRKGGHEEISPSP